MADLTSFVEQVAGDRHLRVEESFGDGYVRLRVGEAERRQAKHDIRCVEDAVVELLRNSRDANARHIFLATTRDGGLRTLVTLDDGDGIPPEMHERVFDARVTSKLESVRLDRWGVHGRGMALFSIRENARVSRVASSGRGKGTSIVVIFDTSRVTERADQSTWPSVAATPDEDGLPALRGPHNIARACCEFALEERGDVELTLGSPAEVVASVRAAADLSCAPGSVLGRLRSAADARALLSACEALGLPVSERNAHRVITGEVRPVPSVATRLLAGRAPGLASPDLARDRRGLRVSPDDLGEFTRLMERDFALLAERYYLSLAEPPRVRVLGDRVSVTFPIEKAD